MNEAIMQKLSREVHSQCFTCGNECTEGLSLKFTIEDDVVISRFIVDNKYQSYEGIVHGGITAAILDCAMVHCLFALDIQALTVELSVKYRHPVDIDSNTEVKAWLVSNSHGLYILKAELSQNNQVKARANGRFYKTS